MRIFLLISFLVIFTPFVVPQSTVIEFDFLDHLGLKVNGAGPLLVKSDPTRNRVILVNTYTSSISVINGKDQKVLNIPISGRIPQHFKDSALAIEKQTGNVYVIGNKCVHLVSINSKKSISFSTRWQYEMIAVDENNGNSVFVGRESKKIGFLNLKNRKLTYINCFEKKEVMKNLNQTPPPPIRKVVFDKLQNKFFVTDGFSRQLFSISAKNGRITKKRKLKTKEGVRWHFAGYDPDNHALYVVIETVKRKVVQAVRIDTQNGRDITVDLPGLTEGVGINYSKKRDEVYIPYDNHPVVHIIDFKKKGGISEVKIPAFGNDASAIDENNEKLYISSWAYGEIDVIDLKSRKLINRIKDVAILPHMFSMTFNPANGKLYIPIGATAVNGSFGSAVTILDPVTLNSKKIYTGWSPIALTKLKTRNKLLIFNSEDEFAEVSQDKNKIKFFKLPVNYPGRVIKGKKDNLYLLYGPHQSYWPVVYIWAAKNGILEIEPKKIETSGNYSSNYQFFNRRIPRLAQAITSDKTGGLYCLQNSWGKEKLFLAYFKQGIRMFAPQERIETGQEIIRETIPRLLKYDKENNKLYVVICGENSLLPGKLIFIDAKTNETEKIIEVGLCPTDLVFNDNTIYISNFDSDTVTAIDKKNKNTTMLKTGNKPLRLALVQDNVFCLNHKSNTLTLISQNPETYSIPYKGQPDNMIYALGKLFITSHNYNSLFIFSFDPVKKKFTLILKKQYPYGETTFDTSNSAFYMRGQFGDSLFSITDIFTEDPGNLWMSDFLSGKLFLIKF